MDSRSADDAEDVILANERVFLFLELHLGAAVFADQHTVADLHFERGDLAIFPLLAGAEGDDLGLLRLLFGGIRDDDATADLLFFFDVLDEDTVPDRLDINFSHIGFG